MVQLQSGYSDRLKIYVKEVAEGQKFSEKENPSFQKVYTVCITDSMHTYARFCIERARTYTCCRTIGRVSLVSEGMHGLLNRHNAYIHRLFHR
jgi:hypothetical protein